MRLENERETFTSRSTDLADLVRQYGPADEGPIRVRFPLEVGILIAGAFADALAYGRSIGVTIEAHRGGGLLTRRYWMVASAPWPALRRFLQVLIKLTTA